MKLEFYEQIFKKFSNIKFHEKLSSGKVLHVDRWTDKQTWRL